MSAPVPPGTPGTPMYAIGGVILAGALLWMGFMAADGLGLGESRSSAVVVGKSYRAAGKTYVTERIGNQNLVVPHATPEAYLLDLDVGGTRAQGQAERVLYDAVRAGDTVSVRYQRRRLTGRTQVVAVDRR